MVKSVVSLVIASLIGGMAGMAAWTPVIALANYLADDGPYFPPALVAFVLAAFTGALILPFQVLFVAYEAVRSKRSNFAALLAGAGAGMAAGAVMTSVVWGSPGFGPESVMALLGASLVQALTAFGCITWIMRWRGLGTPAAGKLVQQDSAGIALILLDIGFGFAYNM